jgi:dGTPase
MKKKLLLYDSNDYERDDIGVVSPKSTVIKEETHTGDARSQFQRDLSRLIHSPAFRKLQGKTQIFPGLESDFFRNRLTHSMEVADIGKSIALRINQHSIWKAIDPIDLDLINFACLAHDLGHPPFGHVGERALNECMKNHGRFEGNAQTLRILTKIEKKRTYPDTDISIYHNQGWEELKGEQKFVDRRLGLNLTSRTLASVLKYDKKIKDGNLNTKDGVIKGYYYTDGKTIAEVKADVLKKYESKKVKKYFDEGKFKTIECSVMDLADDIAYTVFDLEDGLKSGLINLYDLLSINDQHSWFQEFLEKIAKTIKARKNLKKYLTEIDNKHEQDTPPLGKYEDYTFYTYHTKVFFDLIWRRVVKEIEGNRIETEFETLFKDFKESKNAYEKMSLYSGVINYDKFNEIAENGYFRNKLCTSLITYFLDNIEIVPDYDVPAMSKVDLNGEALLLMEVIKQYIFVSQVKSSRMQLVEYRGQEMVKKIFKTLTKEKNTIELLPSDYKTMCSYCVNDEQALYRIICDFIAGMTDRYAVEFYCRLYGESPQSFFKGV